MPKGDKTIERAETKREENWGVADRVEVVSSVYGHAVAAEADGRRERGWEEGYRKEEGRA